MGVLDCPSFIRQNGQTLTEYELDDEEGGIDLPENLDRPFADLINEFKEPDSSTAGAEECWLIIHAYPIDTKEEAILENFFKHDTLKPSSQLWKSAGYDYGDWEFETDEGETASILEDPLLKNNVWRITPRGTTGFVFDPAFTYYAAAIDGQSVEYILTNQHEDVPFELLLEIIKNNKLNFDLTKSKRQIIAEVTEHFKPIAEIYKRVIGE